MAGFPRRANTRKEQITQLDRFRMPKNVTPTRRKMAPTRGSPCVRRASTALNEISATIRQKQVLENDLTE